MGYWSIVVPEAATNLVTNPSIEENASGYTAVGGSVARVTTQQRRGVASLAITPTAGVNDGAYYAITLVAATAYAFSVDVLGVDGVPYKVYIYDATAGVVKGTPTTFTGNGKWQRVTVLATTGANTSHRLYIVKDNSASAAVFYADGVQCEAKTYATTYVDGDQDGCAWGGTAHASVSTRSAQSRAGGRDYDFSSLGVDVLAFSGTGMPPVASLRQERALLPGTEYRGTKAAERVMTLVFLARGASLANLHVLRQTLIDAIKPDRVYPHQPFILRYTGSGKTMEIALVYDAGLEQGEWLGFNEQIALRVIAMDEPLWREEGERAVEIAASQNLTVSFVAGRISGLWSGMNGGLTGGVIYPRVTSLAVGQDGSLYAGGEFSTPSEDLARWNGSAWVAVGSADFNGGSVLALAVMPNGDLIVGGSFLDVNGIANTRGIAKWNGSAWSALGTGVTGGNTVWSLLVGADGCLYAGGEFSQMGGVSNTNSIAKWNGSAWSALSSGTDGYVYALAKGLDGSIYAGGTFANAGGVAASKIAKWNGSVWSALGSGVAGTAVWTIAAGTDGKIYAGGAFTGAGGASGTAYLAQWNGSVWNAVGGGVNGNVRALRVTPDGLVYIGGDFTLVDGSALPDRVALWNGTAFAPLDIDLPGAAVVYAVLEHNGNIYIGFDTSGTATVAGSATVTASNTGSASAYPIIQIKRSGGTSATVQQIKNETTGQAIYLGYALAGGETLTLDLRAGQKKAVSSFYGNATGYIWIPSQLASFALLPGANLLTAYVAAAGSPTVTFTVRWRLTHWAVDSQ